MTHIEDDLHCRGRMILNCLLNSTQTWICIRSNTKYEQNEPSVNFVPLIRRCGDCGFLGWIVLSIFHLSERSSLTVMEFCQDLWSTGMEDLGQQLVSLSSRLEGNPECDEAGKSLIEFCLTNLDQPGEDQNKILKAAQFCLELLLTNQLCWGILWEVVHPFLLLKTILR